MTDVAVVLGKVRFPCLPWPVEDGVKVQPIKGTWTLAPVAAWEKGIHGILSCPNCGQPALVLHDMGEPAEKGSRRLPQMRCTCGFYCHAILEEWDLRKLYCVVHTLYDAGGESTASKLYLHAVSREDALFQFEQSHIGQRYTIVDAAPVIGYFVADNLGQNLTVD